MSCKLFALTKVLPELASQASAKTASALSLLSELQRELPAAGRWLLVLKKLESTGTPATSHRPRRNPSRGDQGDPLEILTDLVSSQPYDETSPNVSAALAPMPPTGTMETGGWSSEFFDSFGISNTDLADLFGIATADFGAPFISGAGDTLAGQVFGY